jgi:hypothetical protein
MNTKLSNDITRILKDTVKKQLALAKASYTVCAKLQAYSSKLNTSTNDEYLDLEKIKLIRTKNSLHEQINSSIIQACICYQKALDFSIAFNELADSLNEMQEYVKEINKQTKSVIHHQQIASDSFVIYISIILKL